MAVRGSDSTCPRRCATRLLENGSWPGLHGHVASLFPSNTWTPTSSATSKRALGPQPTTNTDDALVHAYYCLKWPGESDGSCNGYPSAGTWISNYALELAQRAAY